LAKNREYGFVLHSNERLRRIFTEAVMEQWNAYCGTSH
jgi:hypothetical protein